MKSGLLNPFFSDKINYMTKDNSKVTIKFKQKEYEIEKKPAEQRLKPKNGKDTDKEITIKNYKDGS